MRLILDECIGDRSLRKALVEAGHDVVGEQYPDHSGLLLAYQDNKSTDMTIEDFVRAIANVEATFPEGIAGGIIVLNGFLWKPSNP